MGGRRVRLPIVAAVGAVSAVSAISERFAVAAPPCVVAVANDSYSVVTGENLSGNVTDNDTTCGLSIQVIAGVRHGTAGIGLGGSFGYQAIGGFVGTDQFVYLIDDDTDSRVGIVTIDVLPVAAPTTTSTTTTSTTTTPPSTTSTTSSTTTVAPADPTTTTTPPTQSGSTTPASMTTTTTATATAPAPAPPPSASAPGGVLPATR